MRAACEELHLLLERRTEIMKRIGSIKQTMTGLANMFGEDILGDDTLDLLDRRSGGRRSGHVGAAGDYATVHESHRIGGLVVIVIR